MGSVDFDLMCDCLCSLIEFTDTQLTLTRPEASSYSGELSKPTGKTLGGQGLPPKNRMEASSASGEPPNPTGKILGGRNLFRKLSL